MSDAGDRESFEQDGAAGGTDACGGDVDVIHSERALQTQGRLVREQLPALLERALHARFVGGSRLDLQEPPVTVGARAQATPTRRGLRADLRELMIELSINGSRSEES